jgi:hypothetical protein
MARNKSEIFAELLAVLDEDQKMIDDKNMDTAEYEEELERQKQEYLSSRLASYQRHMAKAKGQQQ